MGKLLKEVSFKTILQYWWVFSFFLIFAVVIIQPWNFEVTRTVASIPASTNASYNAFLERWERNSWDIFLELINTWQEDQGAVLTYLVERWDSLSSIARQFGTTISQISSENALVLWSTLRVGQSLRITFEEWTVVPVPETMTIRTFTEKYNLDYEEFLSINYFDQWADILEKDDEVFVQLNEREALRVWLLQKEDFVRLDFEIPLPTLEPLIEEPQAEQPSPEMVDLVNDIVNETIAQDNDDITQNDLESLEESLDQPQEPQNFEQEVINPEWEEFNPITSEVYEQVIIDAEETQQYLEDLKRKKKEELEANQRAEEERKKAEEAAKKAEELRLLQVAEEQKQQAQQAALEAQQAAERAELEAEQARVQAQQAERQAAISAQQAVGIQQEYIAPPVSCWENQCVHNDKCYDKPDFSECAPQDPNEAWICRWWYTESGWECIKYIPAPASNWKILKQWYFNPHKADSRVRWRWAGQCTAWVAYLWAQNFWIDLRRDLNAKWNAAQRWVWAKRAWLTISQTPIPWSIWWTARSHGYYGHVVYVDEVYLDEWLMLVTDMNYRWAYQFTQRIEKIQRMDGFIYPPS